MEDAARLCGTVADSRSVCDQSVACLKRRWQVLIKGSIDRPRPAVGDSCQDAGIYHDDAFHHGDMSA